jgi:hypothetical protein
VHKNSSFKLLAINIKSFDLYWNEPNILTIRSERQPCSICLKEKFVYLKRSKKY